MIASFLTPMLRLNPDKRAKASELMHHAWLDGIVVQGEIDIIRRAEEDEGRKRRQGQEASAPAQQPQTQSQSGKENAAPIAVDATDADAMKPVDDVVGAADDVEAEAGARVPTIAAPVPGAGRPGHAHTGSRGEVPTLQAVPGGKGKA